MNALENQNLYSISLSDKVSIEDLSDNSWIVVMHASRIPPHVGILINGSYNSLTIKGHETDIDLVVLLKTIQQKKIETIFIKLKKHPVFSLDYQKEICQIQIKQFTQVKPNEASCLSPVKLFLNEFYVVSIQEFELLYELIERLKQNDYIDKVLGLNIEDKIKSNQFFFPLYTYDELQEVIIKERNHFYKK